MKADALEMQKLDGFDGMAFHVSTDGQQLVVLAHWKTAADFNRWIKENQVMIEAREKLSRFGASSANIYLTDSVFGPSNQ